MKEEQEVKNRNSKIGKIRMILPILWGSYEHMYEARETGAQNKVNFLLIVVSFLPVICIALYVEFESPLFLIPTLFQTIALLNLLKSFFITGRKGKRIPWLNVNDLLKAFENDTFEIEFFAILKAAEEDTGIYLKEQNEIIKRALYLVIFSIFLIALASLFVLLNGSIMLYVETGLLVILFVLICFFYNKIPPSAFDKNYEAFKNRIKEWSEK